MNKKQNRVSVMIVESSVGEMPITIVQSFIDDTWEAYANRYNRTTQKSEHLGFVKDGEFVKSSAISYDLAREDVLKILWAAEALQNAIKEVP